jgi:hypothetical protein
MEMARLALTVRIPRHNRSPSLGGPLMDPVGQDRPKYDLSGHQLCNESINGTGFGDSIANNERYGLTNFLAYSDAFQSYPPTSATGYYQAMQSIWTDSTHLFYGGEGKSGTGGYGPDCRFMFPGLSDSLNWGPGCQPPNGQVKTGLLSRQGLLLIISWE